MPQRRGVAALFTDIRSIPSTVAGGCYKSGCGAVVLTSAPRFTGADHGWSVLLRDDVQGCFAVAPYGPAAKPGAD